MYTGTADETIYNQHMDELAQIAERYRNIYRGYTYERGMRDIQKKTMIKQGKAFQLFIDYIKDYYDGKKLVKSIKKFDASDRDYYCIDNCYFSDKRIAVYTSIFGSYDIPVEPITSPNNIDYYIITDQKIEENSKWKKYNLESIDKYIKSLDSVEKNRWVKMHPEILFRDYEYSIYVDGNIEIILDLTCLVNKIGKYGIAMFWHKYNNCVFQEALYNKFSVKKISKKEVDKQVEYLRKAHMPENYGMTTCNVIARRHHQTECIMIMEQWWEEFIKNCRRDQLSFPFVMWKNKMEMKDIATLGNDVWQAKEFIIHYH